MTLKLNRIHAVVKVHGRAKYVQRFMLTSFFALSRNGEKSENPVLRP